jgi:hypothetical protein
MTSYKSGALLEKQFGSPTLLIPVFLTDITKKNYSEIAKVVLLESHHVHQQHNAQ